MVLRTPSSSKRIFCFAFRMYPLLPDSPIMINRVNADGSPFVDITQTDNGFSVYLSASDQTIEFDFDGKPINPILPYWLE